MNGAARPQRTLCTNAVAGTLPAEGCRAPTRWFDIDEECTPAPLDRTSHCDALFSCVRSSWILRGMASADCPSKMDLDSYVLRYSTWLSSCRLARATSEMDSGLRNRGAGPLANGLHPAVAGRSTSRHLCRHRDCSCGDTNGTLQWPSGDRGDGCRRTCGPWQRGKH